MTRRGRRWLAVLGVAAAVAVLAPTGWRHVRAATLLARFSADTPSGAARVGSYEVDVTDASFRVGEGTAAARLYRPRGLAKPPGMVLLHGVHHLGIEEPRLIRFARTLASAGVTVFTPQIGELASYHVAASSVDTVGAAVRALAEIESHVTGHRAQVGLMGLSFAGGVALLAAADPRYAPDVAFVVAVGAHDDLGRVSRFFVLDQAVAPDATSSPLTAHEYGRLVLVYDHLANFFAPEDMPAAEQWLKAKLWEDPHAGENAGPLTAAGAARMKALLSDDPALQPELLACIDKGREQMAAVSPAGHLSGLRSPVLLLHGAGDNVIPATETAWLAREVPAPFLEDVLVSRALQHVELHGEPSLRDQWALIHFMADVLRKTDALRR